jgi:hypothetical protein
MPYFLICPLWGLAVISLLAVTLATRVVRRLAPGYPFAWRILLWSSVGFLAANALLLAALVGGGVLADKLPRASGLVGYAAAFGVAGAVFLGPFLASAAGFAGGAVVGAYLGFRAIQRRSS